MNDYLSKPTEADLLYDLLLRWLPPTPPEPAEPPEPLEAPRPTAATAPASVPTATPSALPSRLPGVDLEAGQRLFGNRPQMYGRVLRRFANEYRHGLPGLDQALAQHDRAQLSRLAHSIKGAAGAVAATALQAQAARLESLAKGEASADELAAFAHELQQTLHTLTTAVAAADLQTTTDA